MSLKKDASLLQGNDRFEGFCIEVLEAIAELCNFNYTIYQVEDNTYGAPNDKGEWSGLIRELIENVKIFM